ncbi:MULTISPECIES: MraY family glycosyltransferase [unclassified Breznakia]|uniref:MraY family glycosyltransferase n=1 Tax=unclassified Breznakia TaxID=2623764 RepID=UPI0024742227|nr:MULTISPECIES: MraY family glycosyltransferase [unclassified Breznakia]MDH6367250.1 UDP-GlcNAc:undecaprenyl-phosphate GlcNAc-1-phosphate transferase [Breznakia sp. PH1-1]MDH6404429.1 UDP-GlcNAc:undecaprenyl-phosphate GlcNAc-1-phosphate transferase [Breznakia sp. PF1-11]MDH6412180.1 UDP-GlcNAc:undecaprenyl-phosphate GlcNAc-1-phosphate transferase [Breznakia sp. PFB1-11]MDH6414417.1 UDP-GlcNAc:undecaprenyl-phosphate GlcNAc-1-phosphate transferase [Breznakia sp. PFB1-14]MDH6416802.1 UDP-GlcNAc:
MQWVLYLVVPLLLSTVITPIVNRIGIKLDIYAHTNERTIHHGKIARVGGIAIYVAFILSMTFFMDGIDDAFRGLLIGSTVMFIGGLIDDMLDLKPILKIAFQVLAAYILIKVGGVELGVIHLPFGIVINMGVVSFLVTFVWIIGISNAINLVDGLDGLAGGITTIVFLTIAAISVADDRPDIAMISLIIAGSTLGFLFFNFHPAKIFMGDCGALFLGFVVAAISLMGFKGSTFITLGFPMLLLSVPIVDTLSAIVRRTFSGKKFTDADKGHFHHVLMRRFGHRNTVLIIYAITMSFGIVAYVYILNQKIGLLCVALLFIGLEIFLETSQMISPKYHPLISIYRILFRKNEKDDKE